MNNPLTELLPARARQILYALLFLAGLVVGALNVAGVDTGAAVDVLAYLGTALGALAASNPSPAPADPAPGQD